MREAKRLLASARLLTLTGAGGVGKTRLALQVAAEVLGDYSGAVWFVDLAPLQDGAFVPTAMARVLAVNEEPTRPLVETLADVLGARSVLLVLDNCEHLVTACAELADRLLRACPGLRILATSREALHIAGETTWRVPSLPLPEPSLTSPQQLQTSPAVQLFSERAAAVQPSFHLDEHNAAAVTEICRRLDGIPLAIELAAARTSMLSPEQIAARLIDRFAVLATGSRTAPIRHQTLRATIQWSYDLLIPTEQRLFERLAVFAGGWTLEAAEAVGSGDGIAPAAVLDLLTGLVDKSLVQAEPQADGTTRYRLLETVRQYAEEKLVDSGDAAAVRDRHRDWYLALAEDAVGGLSGPDQLTWLECLEAEHDNLRAALAWCQADPDGADKEERLAGALGRFWRDRGYHREGFAWLTHAVRRRPGAVSGGRGRALNWAAVIAQHGELAHEQQAALLEESVSVLRQVDAPAELSLALRHLWVNVKLIQLGTPTVDAGLVEEALVIARGAGDQREIGWGLLFLTHVAINRGDLAGARRLVDEALTTLRGLDPNSLLQALILLGRVALAQGEHARAETAFREMVERSHAIGDRVWLADAWLGLAGAVRARGDLAGARGCFRALVSELRAASSVHLLPRVLLGLAMLEAGAGQDRRAARLLGVFEASGGHAAGWPLEGFCLGPDLATLRARLAHEPFAAALAEGRTLTVDQALDEALPADRAASATAEGPPSGLTARELEVLRLVASGRSNHEIANELVLSVRTVERHITNLYAKIGARGKADATAYAFRHGLM
jgi:predicted ATPase/DNA-binding CsgD family transcriptional regulator